MGVYLQELVTEKPWLYLDELQEALFIQGGDLWLVNCSTIWRFLTNQLKWSLTVATGRAVQRDELRATKQL